MQAMCVPGRIQSAITIDGADDRLEGVGKNGVAAKTAALQLARPQTQVVAEGIFARHPGQGLALDQGGAKTGEHTLGLAGKALTQSIGDDEAEHGIAEKFQSFVVGGTLAAVGQGLFQ